LNLRMKLAVISDIHANLEALTAVLASARENEADKIVCLGDIIGYGPNPNECVEIVKSECEYCIAGNHEAAIFNARIYDSFNKIAQKSMSVTAKVLSNESRDFLESLRMTQVFYGDFTAVHATPFRPEKWHYISTMDDAVFNFEYFSTRFCLVGHTHIPGVIALGPSKIKSRPAFSSITADTVNYGSDFDESARFIVNAGSVGQPRDKNPKACFLLIDTDKKTMDFVRTFYDIARYQQKMREAKMPEFLMGRVLGGF